MSRRFDRFIAALARTQVSDRACNQYSSIDGDPRGNAIRRRNLKRYLGEIEVIGSDTLLVGEAPSYRGGRLTGIPFVSELVMLDGVTIRSSPGHILGSGYRKATSGETLSTEASATMVWATIRGIDPLPMLWNAFPFHPFHRGNPRSNRMPDAAELAAGQQFLSALIRLFGFRRIVAIGNHAEKSLTRMNIAHEKVRHPSQGGKRKFVDGMARLSQW
ncbi:MAG TPA: uracil-DNA glycosylase [Thermoanaerobaculia bacterium]|nr:uracil-DNA glycosylase [Thermoanaerobaculia bacterium]